MRERFRDLSLQVKHAGRDLLTIGLLVLSIGLLIASLLLNVNTSNRARANAERLQRLEAEVDALRREGSTMGSAWQNNIKQEVLEELRSEQEKGESP